MSDIAPQLSVILPTYNRLASLKNVIAGLLQQTLSFDTFEVIVVSDGASDGTDDYLKSLDNGLTLRPQFQKNQGVAVARNTGVAAARADLLLFIDDDVVPAPDLLEKHLHAQSELEPNSVVMGPMLTPDDMEMLPWVAWEQQMLYKQYAAMEGGRWKPTARQFYTGNTSVARRLVEAAGGFDPAFLRAEDVELAFRMAEDGATFHFNADAKGYHYAERSFKSWIAIPYAYGRNDVIFTRDKGQSWLLPTVMREFFNRNLIIRLLTRLCLDRPNLTNFVIKLLKWGTVVGSRLKIPGIARYLCSGMWNLRHYQGVADEMGGRQQFFSAIYSTARQTFTRPRTS